MDLRTIEIDFDVHKRIELERQGFSETPNDVLRRLLKIEGPSPTAKAIETNGRPWAGKGVVLPHGTAVRMEYNGQQYVGSIENGEWVAEGKRSRSPSAAASSVALTKNGRHTNLDGWAYWYVKLPGETEWTPLRALKHRGS